MTERYETIAHRWFEEVWNQQREATIDELLMEDAVGHGLLDAEGKELVGPAGFKTLFKAFTNAYPDIHVTVEDTVIQGDLEVARCTVRGTHKGDGIGIMATEKPIEFGGILMIRIKDGRIAEAWNQFDFMNMYQQLGVLSVEQGKA